MSSSSALAQLESEVQGEEFIQQLIFNISIFASIGAQVLREGGILRFTLPTTQIENPSGNDGVSPASKAAIAALPVVRISAEEEGGECTICLTEYGPGEKVKEMPCKHRYHSVCIEKWLGIHGSCPVCRYKMPVDNERERVGEEEETFIDIVFRPRSSGEWDSDGGDWDSDGGDWDGGEWDSNWDREWSESGDYSQA